MGIVSRIVENEKQYWNEVKKDNEREEDRIQKLSGHAGKYLDETMESFINYVSGETRKRPEGMIYPYVNDQGIISTNLFVVHTQPVTHYENNKPCKDEIYALMDCTGKIINCKCVSPAGYVGTTHTVESKLFSSPSFVYDDLESCSNNEKIGSYDYDEDRLVTCCDGINNAIKNQVATAHLYRTLRQVAKLDGEDREKGAEYFEKEFVKVHKINPEIDEYVEYMQNGYSLSSDLNCDYEKYEHIHNDAKLRDALQKDFDEKINFIENEELEGKMQNKLGTLQQAIEATKDELGFEDEDFVR